MTRALQRTIFVGCRQLGLDADARHDLQLAVTGKASLTDMNEGELKLIIKRLKEDGFEKTRSRKKHNKSENKSIRLIHVLWKKLGEKGVLNDPSRAGLNKFIRSRFGNTWGAEVLDVDQLTQWKQIDDVIEALRQWGERAGTDFDWSLHRK